MLGILHFILLVFILYDAPLTHASTQESDEPHSHQAKRVLVLSGEGTHIMGVAKILSSLENALKSETGEEKNTYSSYDLIVGESMGGVLALYLAQGKSASNFIQDVRKAMRDFYSVPRWKKIFNLRGFDTSKYEKALRKLFGEESLDTLLVPTSITIYDKKYSEYLTISSLDYPDIPIWKAARAATSSPYWYKPMHLRLNGIKRDILGHTENDTNGALITSSLARKIFLKDKLELIRLRAMKDPKALPQNSLNGMIEQLIKETGVEDLSIQVNIPTDLSSTDYHDFSIHRNLISGERAIEMNKEKLLKLFKKISQQE